MGSLDDIFRRCLRELDAKLAMKVWAKLFPKLPQPQAEQEMLVTLHMARTAADSSAFVERAYSHAWLLDRGLPSQLPDYLKPSADRMYPREVHAVGVSVMSGPGVKNERARFVEREMSNAVAECYGDGVTDVTIIKDRMREAQKRAERQ